MERFGLKDLGKEFLDQDEDFPWNQIDELPSEPDHYRKKSSITIWVAVAAAVIVVCVLFKYFNP